MRALFLAALAALLVPAVALADIRPPKTKSTKATKDGEEASDAAPSRVPMIATGAALSLAVACGGLVGMRRLAGRKAQ